MGRRRDRTQRLLSDIRYKFITLKGSVPEEIVRVAQEYQVADIVMGKRGHQRWQQVRVGSVSQAVLETTSIPVILVEDRQNEFAVKSHNL
ncbi:MAG: universal stress protein [Coleofasciculus chthonoplastes F2-STO-03]